MRGRIARLGLAGLLAVGGLLAGCNGAEMAEEQPAGAPLQGAALTFTDVTKAAGLDAFQHVNGAAGDKWFPEAMGAGGGFIDYDGDGWEDVLLVGGGSWKDPRSVPALWLYRNNTDGTFSLKTEEAGLGGVHAYGLSITAADYDNDGDEDFFLSTLEENLLFRNEGGRFTEVGEQAGVAGGKKWSSASIFTDADRDGYVDLYVGNYVDWSPETDIWCSLDGTNKGYCTPEVYTGTQGYFYHNNGDGTFSDWTERAGFAPSPGKTLGVVELDFNRDGWPDLAVANDTQPDLLYENNGDGTFTEKGAYSGVAYDENGRARAGMGIDAGVVDATGEETIFVGNFSKEMIGVYRHIGNSLFIDRAAVSKIGRPSLLTLTFGLFLFDADLDGDLDLFAANGHVQSDIEKTQEGIGYRQPPHLFMNEGDGTFVDRAPAIGGPLAQPIVARGAAYADFDRDGDLDVLLTENDGPAHLWRNELNPHERSGANYLRVHVEGTESNRDGLGTQITAVVEGKHMMRRIRTGSSFQSQSEKVATFGLGGGGRVDSLVVAWPGGRVDRFTDVAAGRDLLLTEGTGTLVPRYGPGGEQVASR